MELHPRHRLMEVSRTSPRHLPSGRAPGLVDEFAPRLKCLTVGGGKAVTGGKRTKPPPPPSDGRRCKGQTISATIRGHCQPTCQCREFEGLLRCNSEPLVL